MTTTMNLNGRLARLEGQRPSGPRSVFLSTASHRHEIRRIGPDCWGVTIPWRPEYRAEYRRGGHAVLFAALDDDQRALVEGAAKVVFIVVDPAELGCSDRFTGL